MERIIDLSHEITDGMPLYPGDDETRLFSVRTFEKDKYVAYRLETGLHAGTHIDAPAHLINSGAYLPGIPLERYRGNGCLLDARGSFVIDMRDEYKDKVHTGDIVLILTGHSDTFGAPEYFSGSPAITMTLARFLIETGIKMLGIDFPSPDFPPFPVHKELLRAGIPLLENLTNLKNIPPTPFTVVALPLKIHAEASPVRAVAITSYQ